MHTIKKVFVAMLGAFAGALLGAGIPAAFAATPPPAPIVDQTGFITLFCNIISWFVVILLAISIIMVLVAAFNYVTAGDDTEKTSKARRTLTYAAIGIAVTLIAYGFPQIVSTLLPGNPSVSAFSCGGGTGGSSASAGGGFGANPAGE